MLPHYKDILQPIVLLADQKRWANSAGVHRPHMRRPYAAGPQDTATRHTARAARGYIRRVVVVVLVVVMVVVWRVSVAYPCRLVGPTLTEQPLARSQLEASERGTTCGAFKTVLVLTYRASALQIGLEQAHPEAEYPSRNFAKKGNSWLLARNSHN